MSRSVPLGAHSKLMNLEVIEVLEEEGVDPIRILAQIAKGERGADIEHQLSAAKELASYVHAKKRSVDLSAHIKGTVTYNIVSFADVAPQEAVALADQAKAMLTAFPTDKRVMRKILDEKKERSAALVEAVRTNAENYIEGKYDKELEGLEDGDDPSPV